jgi:hypothetical protein
MQRRQGYALTHSDSDTQPVSTPGRLLLLLLMMMIMMIPAAAGYQLQLVQRQQKQW